MKAATPRHITHKPVTWQRDKDFFKRQTLWELIELTCTESTAHGIGHTWNNRRNILGLLWLIVTVFLFGFLAYVVYILIADFVSRDIQSQTTVKMPEEEQRGLQLPSITLCNRAFFSRRKLEAFNLSSRLTNYLVGVTGSAYLLRNDLVPTLKGKKLLQEAQEELLQVLEARNLTFGQLIDELSYRCEELILMCSLSGTRLTGPKCCRLFVVIPSYSGKCFTFYTSPHHLQTMGGEYLGATLYIKITHNDIPELDPAMLDLTQMVKMGLQLTLTNNLTHPNSAVLGQGVILTPAVYTTIDTSPSVVKDRGLKTRVDWSVHNCINAGTLNYLKDREGFFRTELNCDFGVIRSCFFSFCNCTSYGLDHHRESATPCSALKTLMCYGLVFKAMNLTVPSEVYDTLDTPEVHNVTELRDLDICVKKEKEKCRRVCDLWEYTYSSSHLPIQFTVYQEMLAQYHVDNESGIAVVNAFYPNLRYKEIKLWRKSFSQFMSSLGGYTGVFLGISLVTGIEILVFMGMVVMLAIKKLIRLSQHRTTPRVEADSQPTHEHPVPDSPKEG